ncbi:MAG: hypothetical protein DWQ02_26515 [Bacteroidetes bacterium]|nr:MAG: hypothetical protein DWQ02_26515 [Bacteroidota bacterium]
MAITALFSGGYLDHIQEKTTNAIKSISQFQKETDDGGTENIEKHFQGGYKEVIITSAGNVWPVAQFLQHKAGGGTETITGRMVGGGANLVIDGGNVMNIAEKETGGAAILEHPEGQEISLLDTEDSEDIPE